METERERSLKWSRRSVDLPPLGLILQMAENVIQQGTGRSSTSIHVYKNRVMLI